MSTQKEGFISQSNNQAFRNPWVIGMVASIVIVVAVNVAFITTAVVTNPGLVEENYYERGRDHEKNVQKKLTARSTLGWEMQFLPPEETRVGVPAMYRMSVLDSQGVPIADARVTVKAYRPSDASADFTAELQGVAPGIFEAPMTFPLRGVWDLKAAVARGDDELTFERRIGVSD